MQIFYICRLQRVLVNNNIGVIDHAINKRTKLNFIYNN